MITVVFKLGETDVFDPGEADAVIEDVVRLALEPDQLRAVVMERILSRSPDGFRFKASRPRAVKALFAHAGVELPAGEWIAVAYDAAALKTVGKPWNPVIDRNLCVNCGQCQEYCLFGVYSRDKAGRVVVSNPSGCKPGCPACARLCPKRAIIFPFCPETPINGDHISPTDVSPAPLKKEDLFDRLKKRL